LGLNVSSAADFIDWYERWCKHMSAGRDNRGLELLHLDTVPIQTVIARPRKLEPP
jgi:hypothetical protein